METEMTTGELERQVVLKFKNNTTNPTNHLGRVAILAKRATWKTNLLW